MNIKCVDYSCLHTRDIIIIDLSGYRYHPLALSLPEFLSYSEITQSPCYTIYFYDFLIEKLILLSHENYEDNLYNYRPKIEDMPSASIYFLQRLSNENFTMEHKLNSERRTILCYNCFPAEYRDIIRHCIGCEQELSVELEKFYKTGKWDIVVTFGGKQSLAPDSFYYTPFEFNPIPILEVLLEWIPSHLVFLNDISKLRPGRSDWKDIADVLKNPAYNRFHHHPKAEMIKCAPHKKIHFFALFGDINTGCCTQFASSLTTRLPNQIIIYPFVGLSSWEISVSEYLLKKNGLSNQVGIKKFFIQYPNKLMDSESKGDILIKIIAGKPLELYRITADTVEGNRKLVSKHYFQCYNGYNSEIEDAIIKLLCEK